MSAAPTSVITASTDAAVSASEVVQTAGPVRPGSLSPSRVRAIQRSWRRMRVLLWLCTDLVAATIASSWAQRVRVGSETVTNTVAQASGETSLTYAQVGLAFVLGWIAVLAVSGGYHPRRTVSLWDQSVKVLRSAVGLLAVVGVTSLFTRLQLSRSFVIVAVASTVGLTVVGRFIVGGLFAGLQRLGIGVDRLLIVGPTSEVDALNAQLSRTSGRRARVVATMPIELASSGGAATLRESLLQSVARHGITSVIVCGPAALPVGTVRLLAARLSGSGVNVVVAPGTAEAVGPGVQLHAVGDLFLLRVRDSEPSFVEKATKVLMDRVGALVGLLLFSPLLVFIAVAVRRDSVGPVFFRQRRVGFGGRPFAIVKFRSMAGDAEERLRRDGLYEAYVANGYKLPPGNDPRITPLGAMLRRTSLDELPQLFNVLTGSMSLVGPRPVVPDELACYGELASAYTGVRPGVTGYWQVNGRSDVGFPERAELDAYYYDNRSLRVDLRILVRTVVAVAMRVGAH
jgi:exopolysaccharide biosynthesis polyprenyl glycosylphosphotransferase